MKKTLAAAAAATLAFAPAALGAPSFDAQLLARDDNNMAHVSRYDTLLNGLRPKCRQSRSAVARLTWGAKRVMNTDGYRYSNMTLLLTLSGTITAHSAPVDCADRYAAMIVLLERHR